MDEIYDNLDNYDEVNALVELRSENQELKTKLEEYATSMDKLQKNILQDFDKLTSEFKKLEYNYSSLLRTARTEIERKTQIITNMNAEKDILICKMLQNGNKSFLNYKRDLVGKKSKVMENEESGIDSVKTKKALEEPNGESEKERIDESVVVSSERKAGSFRFDTGQNSKNTNKTKSNGAKDSESKENLHHVGNNNNTKPRALSLKNRRKSMPVVSIQDVKCSSDEEYNKPEHATEYSIKNIFSRNIRDRHYNHKYTNKISESSSIDDKTSGYYESSRETYNGRNSRHYDNDKYRNRDKCDYSQRYRRDLSPDRHNKRRIRDNHTESNQRLEYSRSRVLESPPNEKYNHSRSRKNTVHRPYYTRLQHNEQDRYKHHQENYSVKHKMASDHDESRCKRKKFDPYGNHEDTNWYEREVMEQQTIADTFERLESQYTSCQSPDYVYTDMSEPIREIMNTALTQLEDPRLTSNKYSLKNHNDKTFLSTVIDKYIDLKIIDKSTWGIKKVSIPAALLYQPTSGQIKHLAMDNQDPREISYQKNGFSCEDPSKTKVKHQPSKSYPVNDYRKILSQNKSDDNMKEEEAQLKLIHDFTVSKISCDNNSEVIEKEGSNFIENSEKYSNCKNYEDKTKISERKTSLRTIGNNSRSLPFIFNTSKNDITCHDAKSPDSKQVYDDTSYLFTSKGVVGDLELSDETCDTTELLKIDVDGSSNIKIPQNSSSSQGNDMQCNTQQKICILKEQDSKTHIETNSKKFFIEKPHKERKVIEEKIKKVEEKVKSKKKSHKSKDPEKNNATDKKSKRKKEKEKSKVEKTKLEGLFGESSGNSLITPDDLGIIAGQPKNKSHYTSIFDDAQDSIELKEAYLETENSGCSQLVYETNNDNPKTDATVILQGNDIKPLKNDKGNNETEDDDVTSKLSMIYANLEPITQETEALKTVIISTGYQPEVTSENNIKNYIEPTSQNNDPKIPETLVNDLPTSTPQPLDHIECNSKRPDSSCNSNNSRLSNSVTNSDTLDSENVTDVPDVRIFVRRKRRFMKKPLVT